MENISSMIRTQCPDRVNIEPQMKGRDTVTVLEDSVTI
jgi:hypothetical protein